VKRGEFELIVVGFFVLTYILFKELSTRGSSYQQVFATKPEV